jgi:hypothetical protein
MTTEQTATMTTLIARIEADARELLALAPQSRHAQAILDAAEGLRRANRKPLPEGWRWSADGFLRAKSGGWIACTFTSGAWVIFAGLDDAADEVAGSREVDEDTARAVVEEYLWQHGWPS